MLGLSSSVPHCVMLPRAVSAQQWNLSGVEAAQRLKPAVWPLAFWILQMALMGAVEGTLKELQKAA